MTALLLPLLVAAATPAATAPAPAAPAPIDYARMIDEAIDGGRAIQAETMLGQWRAEAQPANAQPLAIATARLALAQGRDGDAEAAFAGMSQAGSTDCRVDEGLGIARLRLGRPQEALAPLQRAVAACAGRWRAWNGLGVAYDDAKSWTASAAAYERAFQLTDKPVLLLNNYGMSLMAQGRAEEAAAIFDKARDMAPDDAKIITNGDAAYVMSGRDIQRRPTDDADAWAKRLSDAGQVALRIGDVAKGQAYLSRAMTESERFLPEAAAALATIGPQKP